MENIFYEIRWSFTSELGYIDINRYCTSFKGEVYEIDYEQEIKGISDTALEKKIGQIFVDFIHVDLARFHGYKLVDVSDVNRHALQLIGQIYDFKLDQFNEDILDHYDGFFDGTDICIVKRVELIASHRNKGIGTRIMKDIYYRFNRASLMVLKVFPLQFELALRNKKEDELTQWDKLLDLKSLELDEEKAFYLLKAFYQKVGFVHINGYDELMFLNPEDHNSKIEEVEFYQ